MNSFFPEVLNRGLFGVWVFRRLLPSCLYDKARLLIDDRKSLDLLIRSRIVFASLSKVGLAVRLTGVQGGASIMLKDIFNSWDHFFHVRRSLHDQKGSRDCLVRSRFENYLRPLAPGKIMCQGKISFCVTGPALKRFATIIRVSLE